MNRFLILLLILPAATAAAGHAPKGLGKRDFAARPLTRKLLRQSGPKLSDKRFAEKIASGSQDSVMFEREFPGAHWKQMSAIPRTRMPGKDALIIADDHFLNYGFIKGVEGLVPNDFDDSGRGPVAGDNARYFGILRGAFGKKTQRPVLKQYVRTLADPREAVSVPKRFLPDWDKIREDELAKLTEGDDFAYKKNDALRPIRDAATWSKVKAAIGGVAAIGDFAPKAIAKETRNHGGSSGEDRILVYGERRGQPVVYELKPAPAPAIDQYSSEGQPSMDTRLGLLKHTYWGKDVRDNYVYVKLDGKRWLLRNRLEIASLDVTNMKEADRVRILRAQVSNQARAHAAAWAGSSPDEIQAWIRKTSKTEKKVWRDGYEAQRGDD